jgi:hypothetical protein
MRYIPKVGGISIYGKPEIEFWRISFTLIWKRIITLKQCCGSGSGRIRIILPDPDPDWYQF